MRRVSYKSLIGYCLIALSFFCISSDTLGWNKVYSDYFGAGDLYYQVLTRTDSTGTVAVMSASRADETLTIPDFVECDDITYEVTEIRDLRTSTVKNVVIGSHLTAITDYAFVSCDDLAELSVSSDNLNYSSKDGILFNKQQTVLVKYPKAKEGNFYEIPDTVVTIGKRAFEECINLTDITIPDNVTSIDSGAFLGCSHLKKIVIPDSVISIAGWAFMWCAGLTDVTLGKGITSIGDRAFESCSSLKHITIPDNVTSIAPYAFDGCRSLESIVIPNSVTTISYSLFSSCVNLKNITIPDSVTSIGIYAFVYCNSLESIVIPDSVISIAENCFNWCNSLTNITIGSGVVSIGKNAFQFNPNLTEISVSERNKVYSSVNGVLFNKDRTELIQYPAGKKDITYVVPDSVTSVGNAAFCECYNLVNIIISAGATSIGMWAFDGCMNLEHVFYQGNVPNVDSYAYDASNALINYYPEGNASWEAVVVDGQWQNKKTGTWNPTHCSETEIGYSLCSEESIFILNFRGNLEESDDAVNWNNIPDAHDFYIVNTAQGKKYYRTAAQ